MILDGEHALVAIDGALTLAHAEQWKERVLAAVLFADRVELDLAEVSEIDAAGLQVLMQAQSAARSLRRELHLLNHSPVVLAAFASHDLFRYFSAPPMREPCLADAT